MPTDSSLRLLASRTRAPTLAAAMLAVCATGPAVGDDFEIPVVPCDLLAGECSDAAVRPVRNGAWAEVGQGRAAFGSGNGARIRTVSGSGGRTAATLGPRRTSSGSLESFQRTSLHPVAMELGPREVTVSPGTTVLIEIALGHLNRIVTPFADPVLHTVSDASTRIDGRVLYVATNSEEPVSLYITDGPESETALSLTLAPRYIPPREIRLHVPGYRPPSAQAGTGGMALSSPRTPAAPAPDHSGRLANAGAGYTAVGASSDYVTGLVDALRASARGGVPSGWHIEKAAEVRCKGTLKVRRTRLLVGPTAAVAIAGVRNGGPLEQTVDEHSCSTSEGQVAAVAAWPRRRLAAREETEVYLVVQQAGGRPDPTGRPR